jgi:hypothetical protein
MARNDATEPSSLKKSGDGRAERLAMTQCE